MQHCNEQAAGCTILKVQNVIHLGFLNIFVFVLMIYNHTRLLQHVMWTHVTVTWSRTTWRYSNSPVLSMNTMEKFLSVKLCFLTNKKRLWLFDEILWFLWLGMHWKKARVIRINNIYNIYKILLHLFRKHNYRLKVHYF